MTDIELTKKIKYLEFRVEDGRLKSDLVHYRIVNEVDYIGLEASWISPDMPTASVAVNDIQRKAVEAYISWSKNK